MNDHLTISTFQLFQLYPDVESARVYFEKRRWKGHVVCPHCGCDGRISARSGKRIGYYRCGDCKEEFTVRTKTIFERSHVPLNKWLYAMYLTVTARKGISSLQLSKQIGVTQKTAWFMLQRIREACGNDTTMLKGIVEVDEVYIGGRRKNMPNAKRAALKKTGLGRGADGKQAVIGMRERGGNTIAMPVPDTTSDTLQGKIRKHVAKGTSIYTDEAAMYKYLYDYEHEFVKHTAGEYVGPNDIHTNSIESVWAQLKRGLYGVWHHASRKHLHRYVNEATFRLNEANCEVHTLDRLNAFTARAFKHRITYQEVIA